MFRLLCETETAYRAGFQEVADMNRAIRSGHFPKPTRTVGRRRFWSEAALLAWIDDHPLSVDVVEQEREALRRIADA